MSKGKDAKPHIGIFGRRNNGKSSLINALSGQDIAIVSNVPGTTTDPVKKSMEIPNIGPVVIVDTAGIDDVGELGERRIAKSLEILKLIDLAIIVISRNIFAEPEKKLIVDLQKLDVPFIVVNNKSDLEPLSAQIKNIIEKAYQTEVVECSTLENYNINNVIEAVKRKIPESAYRQRSIIGDLISYGDIVLLITPIDSEAPEGRLILPQVQMIRDILDNDCVAIVLKERELDSFLKNNPFKPKLVITDSQIFLKADASIPKDIMLTSFSIVLARYKGDFEHYLDGTPQIDKLKDGDKVLILESCSHQVSCEDIGRMKLPRWISNYTGKNLEYDVLTGLTNIPCDIKKYALVIQCGGCVITKKQVHNRLKPAIEAGVPVTNYGMAIAYLHGIFHRAVAPFKKLSQDSNSYL